MLRVTCDLCGKDLRPGEDQHYVVKIEVFTPSDPNELTEADLEEDHLDAVGQLLRDLEATGEESEVPAPHQHFRYDLCSDCRQKFAKDPLSKLQEPQEVSLPQSLGFSEN